MRRARSWRGSAEVVLRSSGELLNRRAPSFVVGRRLEEHEERADPKWIIQRYRLLEAVEQLKARSPPPLADLAASLGYSDQAHFSRDFKRVSDRHQAPSRPCRSGASDRPSVRDARTR